MRDKTVWQYKVLMRNLSKEEAPNEEELNTLGNEGWELAGTVTDHPLVRFYFKRLKERWYSFSRPKSGFAESPVLLFVVRRPSFERNYDEHHIFGPVE